jgi:hypothetical protein
MKRAFASLVVFVLVAAFARGDGSRLRLAEISANGPLERATFDCGSAGRATIEFGLAAGETRTLVVALPSREGREAAAPVASDAHARFVAWTPDAERVARFAAVPLGLRSRTAPPAPDRDLAPNLAAFAVAIAAAFFVGSVRARPGVALAVGGAAAALILSLESFSARAPEVRVARDYDVREGAGLEWRVARDRFELGADAWLSLTVDPEPAEIELRVDARVGGRAHATTVAARGATLALALAPAAAAPRVDGNRYGDFVEVWTRASDGDWAYHGEWTFGEALGPPRASDRRPPGWINPALPQGRELLVAREAAEAGAPEVWVRVLGP